MRRVLLVVIPLGDPADFEVYAGAAIYEWWEKVKDRLMPMGLKLGELWWGQGPMLPHSVTVAVSADVEPETEVLLKLAGLTWQGPNK